MQEEFDQHLNSLLTKKIRSFNFWKGAKQEFLEGHNSGTN